MLSDSSGWFAQILNARLMFPNPEYLDREKMGRWTGNTPEYLRCYEQDGSWLTLPRGFTGRLLKLCLKHNVKYTIHNLVVAN